MARVKPRLQGKPGWVIASVGGAIAWGIVTIIAIVFFEAALISALLVGLAAFAIVAAPTIILESFAAGMAVVLELSLGAIALVVLAPLALLGSCG